MRRLLTLLVLLSANAAFAQPAPALSGAQVTTESLTLSGPRFGVTYVTADLARRLDDEVGAAPVITQFGWQFETRLFATETGLSGLTELVPLIGVLDQGLFLPSLSFLVGLNLARCAYLSAPLR